MGTKIVEGSTGDMEFVRQSIVKSQAIVYIRMMLRLLIEQHVDKIVGSKGFRRKAFPII
jgi:hypothetical protein